MGRNDKLGNASECVRNHMEALSRLPYVNDVSICGSDRLGKHMQGIRLDNKAFLGYTRGNNGVPVTIPDKRNEKSWKVVVHARPDHYNEVYEAVLGYILDESGRVSRDPLIKRYFDNIRKLSEVRNLERTMVVAAAQPSGIHDIVKCEDCIECTVVGRNQGVGQRLKVWPRYGMAEQLRYVLSNPSEYFGKE